MLTIFILLRHTQKQYNSLHSPQSLNTEITNSRFEKVRAESRGAHFASLLPTSSEVLADVFLVCLTVLLLDLIDLVLQLYNSPLNLIVLTHQRHPI